MFSSGGVNRFKKLRRGPRLELLRFGDFDGNGKTDVFITVPLPGAPDGAHQWMFSPGGVGDFKKLAKGPSLEKLGFGDFDGDGKTDVFYTERIPGARDEAHQWMFSSGGVRDFQKLAQGPPLEFLRFGDFDGDRKTDVFTHVPGEIPVQYVFSSGGSGAFQNLTKGSGLYNFGDFDGDGKTDVFVIGQFLGHGSQWMFSPGGAGPFRNLAVGPSTKPEFGDFDGDKKTDVFYTVPLPGAPDGAHQWKFSSGGVKSFENLAQGPSREHLRFGDFDGDKKTDVFAVDCR